MSEFMNTHFPKVLEEVYAEHAILRSLREFFTFTFEEAKDGEELFVRMVVSTEPNYNLIDRLRVVAPQIEELKACIRQMSYEAVSAHFDTIESAIDVRAEIRRAEEAFKGIDDV
jgi:hypothetical protein